MCRNLFMIDTDIIQCLLEDLLDKICLKNAPCSIKYSSSSKLIEDKFNQSIHILNNSIKQFLTYELNTVINNGQLTTTTNIRHGRYYNPATTLKQMNDLNRRLQWIQQRQMIVKQFHLNHQEKPISSTNVDLNSMENLWFNQRFQMLDNSFELLKKQEDNEEEINSDESTCARCRIYQRKKRKNKSELFQKLKHIYQIHHEHNYSSSTESDLMGSLSKIADRIGHTTNFNVSNTLKKHPSNTTIKKKPPKLQSSISLIVTDSTKTNKRTSEDSRNVFISNHYDLTNKRQKRIASPQSNLSVSSTVPSSTVSSSSPHEILTPSCRLLINSDIENTCDQQENEDITDESYIRRHIRCELEQESWLNNPPPPSSSSSSHPTSLPSNRKSGTTLQTSISFPNGLSTSKYRYHLTSNGIAYTETIDNK